MKHNYPAKFFICLTGLLAALAFFGVAAAGPTWTPKGVLALELKGEHVFEQRFQDYDLERSTAITDDARAKSASFKDDSLIMAAFSYGLTDRLNLTGGLGLVSGGRWQEKDLASGQDWQAELGNQLAWQVGLAFKLLGLNNGFSLIASASYLRYDNRPVTGWENTSLGISPTELWNFNDKLDYWQADLGLEALWSWKYLTGFIGLGLSYAEAGFTGRWRGAGAEVNYSATLRNSSLISAQAGLATELGRGLSLWLKGSFAARTSLDLGLSWRFSTGL